MDTCFLCRSCDLFLNSKHPLKVVAKVKKQALPSQVGRGDVCRGKGIPGGVSFRKCRLSMRQDCFVLSGCSEPPQELMQGGVLMFP